MNIAALQGTAFLRLRDIIGDRKSDPPRPGLIPVGASTWWAGVKDGRYPKPVKLGPRVTAWRCEDIRALIERLGREAEAKADLAAAQAEDAETQEADAAKDDDESEDEEEDEAA